MTFFKIVSVPTDNHTASNCVYVHPDDLALIPGQYIEAGGSKFPYTVRAEPAGVAKGTIAMNLIQRKCCGITTATGDGITIPAGGQGFKKPAGIITKLKVEIEHSVASKKGGSVSVASFVSQVRSIFGSQFFRMGQVFCVVGESYKVSAKIIELQEISKIGDTDIGQLVAETVVLVKAKESSGIALTDISDEQQDMEQGQIVKKFDLENLGIGGLRTEFAQVFRRAFASRIFPKSIVKKLGIKHVKGVLLYGPPGTGKTLIARKIGEVLNCRTPKIVNGPEVFNKFVGGTEENVRKLFEEAEQEQQAKGEQSGLHLIIFDEFDAICKQRGAVRDSTGVNDNVVNQLLSKIDGVSSLNNVLLIGMTNRKDLLDEAILRPGRFEVHVEIGLPTEDGRVEIFRIHTKGMRDNNSISSDVKLDELAKQTKNFSGAEIEGVVRSATAFAFNRHIDFENPTETINAAEICVAHADFVKALQEVTPAFGQAKDECANSMRSGIIPYGPVWSLIDRKLHSFVEHLRTGTKIDSLSVMLNGHVGCGKSAVAAYLAMHSEFPYVKVISNDNLVSYGEMQKSNIIRKAFEDAYKSPLSVVVLDDIERLIEYSHMGGRYSNILLQTLLVLIKRPPPDKKRLLVIGTTSLPDVMESLELASCFSVALQIPTLDSSSLPLVAKGLSLGFLSSSDETNCMNIMPGNLTIKKLILVLEMASMEKGNGNRVISYDSFHEALQSTGAI